MISIERYQPTFWKFSNIFFLLLFNSLELRSLFGLFHLHIRKKQNKTKQKKTHKKNVLRCSQGQWNFIRCILRRSQWREKQTITFSYFLFSSKIKARYEPSDNKQNVWYLSSGHNFGTEDVNILIRSITILFVIIVEKPFNCVWHSFHKNTFKVINLCQRYLGYEPWSCKLNKGKKGWVEVISRKMFPVVYNPIRKTDCSAVKTNKMYSQIWIFFVHVLFFYTKILREGVHGMCVGI